jgi:hypothetical protein
MINNFKQSTQKKEFKLNQRHWLNIIIFLISLMFILSMFVGRMMNKAVESANLNTTISNINTGMSQPVNLILLDFGELQLTRIKNDWLSSNNGYSKEKLLVLITRWQALLGMRGSPINQSVNSGKTVLIYLADIQQPLIAKVNIMNAKLRISFINQNLEFYLPVEDLNLYYPEVN